MIMFLELPERAEPIEDIAEDAIDDDDDGDGDVSTIMNIDYIIIQR